VRPPGVQGADLLGELGLVLAVVGGMLAVAALVTARPPRAGLAGRDAHLDRWQALHGGHDPRASVWLRGWSAVADRLARPLARAGVHPHALTAASVWLVAVAALPAMAGGRWTLAAGALVAVSGLVDGLDGAVAALTDRATRAGYVLDSVADRVSDVAALGLVVLAGGPAWVAVLCGLAFFFHEYLRARAAGAGAGEVVAVTVDERAQRVIVLAVTLVLAGVLPAVAAAVATTGLLVMLLLSMIGLAQLTVGVARALPGDGAAADGPDGPGRAH
jgi:CDP-diacylglycerol--glycerol-3-phosphate 3-phosphatidyltransferase